MITLVLVDESDQTISLNYSLLEILHHRFGKNLAGKVSYSLLTTSGFFRGIVLVTAIPEAQTSKGVASENKNFPSAYYKREHLLRYLHLDIFS